MSILKKISVFTAAIMLFVTILPGISYAAADADNADNSVQVDFAKGLGLIEEYDKDANVTVGDVANAVNILTNDTTMADRYFHDYSYESEAVFSDIISAYVDIAGYTKLALYNYGDTSWNAIRKAARDMDLISDASGRQQDKVTMESFVNMSYRLLYSKSLKATYASDGNTKLYKTDEDYMSYILHMYTVNDIVEAVSFSSLQPDNETEGDSIIIGGKTYKCDKSVYEEMIGRKVTALVKDDNGKQRIIAIHDESKILEISAEDIIKNSAEKTSITYFKDGSRKTKVRLDKTVDVLYNYSAYPDFKPADLEISQGRLVLIDNDEDGVYEVVRIEEYEAAMIFSVSQDAESISDSYGNEWSIKKMIENDYPIYEEEKLITAINIPINKVAAFYRNKTGEIVRMYITDKTVAGYVGKIDTAKNQVWIDGTKYTYTPQVKELLERVKTGDMITAKLDYYGAVAYFEMAEDLYSYGYLTDFTTGSGFTAPQLKIFTEMNEFSVYDAKDKIRVNGALMQAQKAFDKNNYSTGLWDEVGKISQLIKYRTNSKNEITEILTATNFDPGNSGRPWKMKDDVFKYYSGPNTICSDTRLNEDTRVFLIPEDLSYEKRFKYGRYKILSNDTSYTCQVYDIDQDRYAGAVVMRVSNYGSDTLDDLNGAVYLIKSVSTALNDEGEETVWAEAQQKDGTPVELKFNRMDMEVEIGSGSVASYLTLKDLRKGDLVQMVKDTNNTGEVSRVKIWFSNGNTVPYETTKRVWYSSQSETCFISDGWTFAYGVVKKQIKYGIMINNQTDPSLDSWDRVVTFTPTTPVYIIEDGNDKIIKASTSDLVEGEKVFSLIRNGKPEAFYIYR